MVLLCHSLHTYVDVCVCEKVETLQNQITTSTTEVRTSSSELTELKRSYQTLEINRQSALKEVRLQTPQQAAEAHLHCAGLAWKLNE